MRQSAMGVVMAKRLPDSSRGRLRPSDPGLNASPGRVTPVADNAGCTATGGAGRDRRPLRDQGSGINHPPHRRSRTAAWSGQKQRRPRQSGRQSGILRPRREVAGVEPVNWFIGSRGRDQNHRLIPMLPRAASYWGLSAQGSGDSDRDAGLYAEPPSPRGQRVAAIRSGYPHHGRSWQRAKAHWKSGPFPCAAGERLIVRAPVRPA